VSLGESGCFASKRFTSFHHDVMRQMLILGLLRLWWTDLDGQPAAIEYALVGSNTVYFYQSGIEPSLAREYPGWLSTISSLRYVQAQGFRAYDFLRGDEVYKASWGAEARCMTELRIVAPRLAPRLRHTAWRTRKLAGRIKRALLSSGGEKGQKHYSTQPALSVK
jgi:CelD/BcsL family acetyltransferase involved in cellulose biosynthesis